MLRQRTIARPVEVCGFGLFHGHDCRLRFLPAEENSGIAFRRVDLPGRPVVAAIVDNVVPAVRRTVLSKDTATVEMVEHVMAALAGLWIDNCVVELDAIEPPVCDGSSQVFTEKLLEAGVVEQTAAALFSTAGSDMRLIASTGSAAAIDCHATDRCIVGYELNYSGTILTDQAFSLTITPETFVNEIAFARTFVLATEIEMLQRNGLGRRATTHNVLVIEADGVRENAFRRPEECARHKILDSIGDLALCGSRFHGRFLGKQSGHSHNHEIARQLRHQSVSRHSDASICRVA